MESKVIRVAVIGPESTGKTTLTKAIAANMPWTVAVPEMARLWLAEHRPETQYPKPEDYGVFLKSQYDAIREAERKPHTRVVVSDTEYLTTLLWSRKLHNMEIDIEPYWHMDFDLYLIQDTGEVPFEPDAQRYGDNERQTSVEDFEDILAEYGIVNSLVISGTYRQRLLTATSLIDIVMYAEEKYHQGIDPRFH